ncbi:zinc uptake protein ZrgA [Vibrio agarilyticus]|nr:DUF2796 domain-containing protein [Vibrio agarilyticus]
MTLRPITLALCGLFASSAAIAASHGHEAHVHGKVALHIAQDGPQVLIEVEAPGADVVGFEHAPSNANERAAIAKANETLRQGDALLLLAANAGCQLTDADIDSGSASDDHDEHEHHDHHDDAHQEHSEHDHHGHDDHDQHSEHNHGDHDAGHNTFRAHYLFQCDNIAALDAIDVTWFKAFPATQSIEANLFLDNIQGVQELTATQSRIHLTR